MIFVNKHLFIVLRRKCTIKELEQIASGDCERFGRGDIHVATECTVAVPLPKSPPLTRPPATPPELVPPCRIPPLCYYCN